MRLVLLLLLLLTVQVFAGCGVNKYMKRNGDCVKCPKGSNTNGLKNKKRCDFCDVGYGSNGEGGCQSCFFKEYNNVISWHASACNQQKCRSGHGAPKISDERLNWSHEVKKCSICEKGEFNTGNLGQCGLCPGGTESLKKGMRTCKPCEQGTYDDDNDSKTSCVRCPSGSYQNVIKQKSCKTCPEGSWSGNGAKTCTNCKHGTWSKKGAHVCTPWYTCSVDEEMFIAPSSRKNRKCKKCSDGMHSPFGNVKCLKIPKQNNRNYLLKVSLTLSGKLPNQDDVYNTLSRVLNINDRDIKVKNINKSGKKYSLKCNIDMSSKKQSDSFKEKINKKSFLDDFKNTYQSISKINHVNVILGDVKQSKHVYSSPGVIDSLYDLFSNIF